MLKEAGDELFSNTTANLNLYILGVADDHEGIAPDGQDHQDGEDECQEERDPSEKHLRLG